MQRKLPEKDIERRVCEYAKKYGTLTRKFTSPQQRSVPDRIFIFPNGLSVYIEFKSRTGKLTDGQIREINRLIINRQWVYVINDIELGKLLIDALFALPEGAIAPRFPRLPT